MPSEDLPASYLADLSRQMMAGDNAAWLRFHERYGGMMFRILLAATQGDPHLASEALQRAYLRVSRHVRFCDNEAMWNSWLRALCRSALSDARRRQYSFWNLLRRQREVSTEEEAVQAIHENEWFDKLDAAMAELPSETKSLLEAKYFRRESVQMMAERLSLSPKSVESRLTRARVELRERLMKQSPGPTNDERP